MAADQRRKRLNGGSVAGCSPLEQLQMKKRKLKSPENGLNSNLNISLKWDERKKKVIAKQEQIGVSKRNLQPFTDPGLGSTDVLGYLADAFSVPREIFELENLTNVLSFEVWLTQLSEAERNYLEQFLPSGRNAEQVVEALLAGDNFHFGNPLLKWGTSLCSGNFHPDAVIHKEWSIKADRKAYYLELQKYHHDILDYLQKLKHRWESCKDPENENFPKFWRFRSRRDPEKKKLSNACESKMRDLEQDVTATSESCSSVADEKAWSSDNQNFSVMKGRELQKRSFGSQSYERSFVKKRSTDSLIALDDMLNVGAKSRKGYKIDEHSIQYNDGAQYMSYVKISKKQHELVKSMKHCGKSIQSRSMNRVLGNLESLHVQPYEVFLLEQQQKKLQEHWLKLASEDLPAFYATWKERKRQLWEVTRSLKQEMEDKLECQVEGSYFKLLVNREEEKQNSGVQDEEIENSGIHDKEEENSNEEENFGAQNQEEENSGIQDEEEENSGIQDDITENPGILSQDDKDNAATCHESNIKGHENFAPGSSWNQSPKQIDCCIGSHESNHIESDHINYESNIKDDGGSGPGSPWDQSPDKTIYPCASHELIHTFADPEKNHVSPKSDNFSSDVCGKMNTLFYTVNQEISLSSGGDVWLAASRPNSYFDCTAVHKFTTNGFPLMKPQVSEDQQTHLIDMESGLRQERMRKDLLHRQSDGVALCSYQNQDRNELLPSLLKGQELSYHQGQKHTSFCFQPPNSSMMGDHGQFPGHFQEHLGTSLPLEQEQKKLSDFQNMSQNIYSSRDRHLIPRQENLQLGNMHNWNVNNVSISEPLQSHLNGRELLSQNWFPREHRVRGGWTNLGGIGIQNQNQSQSIINGSSADQSLFSVLPNSSRLRAANPYGSVGSTELTSSSNFGLMAVGVPGISNALPNPAHPLDYLGGRDSMMPDDMRWVNLPQQSPASHDPMGKPY